MKLPNLITDLSGVYGEEGFIDALESSGQSFDLLDLRSLEGTFCYCDSEAADSIRKLISPWLNVPGLHWIDSGDYHYLSLFFCEAIKEPFTLVLLDNHPDDMGPEFPGVLSCGSWAGVVRKKCPFVKDIITIGPEGERPSFGNLEGKVYISLDKDIMDTKWARTDWSQGGFSLDEIKAIIRNVAALSDGILGIDICGELSRSQGAKDSDLETNLRTNLSLMSFIGSL